MTGPARVRFHCPVPLISGDGAAADAGEVLAGIVPGGSRVLLVVDPACARADLHAATLAGLVRAGLEPALWTAGRPNPGVDDVRAAVPAFAGAAALVALGGGSTLDLAKGIAAASRTGGDLRGHDRRGAALPAPLPPLVAIPTTAGSGSEVTPFAVLVARDAGEKVVLASPALFPRAALLDAGLLRSLPREAMLAAALDALTHAIETFLGLRASPAVDALALEALDALWRALPAAAAAWPDTSLGDTLLWASTLAGMAVASGSAGIVHAISNLLSARYDLSHGLANGAALAPVVRFLAGATRDRLARLAPVVGAAGAEDVPRAVERFVRGLVPGLGLGTLGVPPGDLPALAAAVAADYQAQFNSRRVPDQAAALRILEEAF